MRNRSCLSLVLVLALAGCATYVPPAPAPESDFSKDLDASYDQTWSALTYVAGASFFKIKAFEKASGLMTLDFDLKDVTPYVDCGSMVNKQSGVTEPALTHLLLNGLTLSGTANINIRSEGKKRTAIQFNSQYDLVGYRDNGYGIPVPVIEWKFNSGSSDTEMNFGVPVVCRPSYKIEQDFLTEVEARL